MNEKKEKGTAIEPGKIVCVEAPTRNEATVKIAAIRKEALEAGLEAQSGGFIYKDGDTYKAEIIFTKNSI